MGVPEGVPVGLTEGVQIGLPEGVPIKLPVGVPVRFSEGVEPTTQGPMTYSPAKQYNDPEDIPQANNIPPNPPSTCPQRQNIGTWKDGPAKIRTSPMDNK
jgi:hypothetical protein